LPPELRSARLALAPASPNHAGAVAAFWQRNRAAHARWNPTLPESAYTEAGQRERLAAAVKAAAEGRELRWLLLPAGDASRVLGHLSFTQIARGPFFSAMLGYAIDAAHEGQGLMREALQAALDEVFSARIGLHRVQANVRPENERSLALLTRLGFEREGLAREYLFIDGGWRDHVLTALRAPGWAADRAPSATVIAT
jgi:[ribosomal protein S5]-alanine N-acetyltransferase